MKYNKLVRDRIPEIIEGKGGSCVIRRLSEAEFLQAADAKLDEELKEYHENPCLEELADLMEVLLAAAQARGWTPEILERTRREKAEQRGSFQERIFLESAES